MAHRIALTISLVPLILAAACQQNATGPTRTAESGATADMLAAKGGGKPPSEVPVTATFRCPGPACTGGDRITGDGTPYAAFLDGGGNLRITLPDASRSVTLDYTECLQPCPTGRRWFTTISPTGTNGLLLHTSVLIPGTESETTRGFFDIPVGATWYSRIKIGTSITSPAGVNLTWGTRFNPFFPGSTNLTVTRVSDSEWFVEASASQSAWVVSIGETRRDGGEVFEGNYRMPFRITVVK